LQLVERIAPLIGAATDEVPVSDSTSVNTFKMTSAAMMARGLRHRIATKLGNFPSGNYVLHDLAQLSNGAIEVAVVLDQTCPQRSMSPFSGSAHLHIVIAFSSRVPLR
jgi:kynureninase